MILVGAVLGCLGVFGIQTASFAAVLAAAGFAIGMAFQGTLGNFSAGIMLLAFRPFKVGDFVEVNGEKGTCEHIDLFTCEFRTLDNKKLIIPNGSVFGGSSIDWQVRVWCKTEDYWDVWQATTRACKLSLDEAGIGIPFPQQDVHLDESVIKALSN